MVPPEGEAPPKAMSRAARRKERRRMERHARTPRRPRNLRVDLTWGMKGGLLVATIFSSWAGLVWVLSQGGPWKEQGLSLPAIVGGYLVGGVSAGAIVGLLRPLTRSKLGAYAVGYLAGCFVMAALLAAVAGPPTGWNAVHVIGLLFVALYAGYGIGSELLKTAGSADRIRRKRGLTLRCSCRGVTHHDCAPGERRPRSPLWRAWTLAAPQLNLGVSSQHVPA